MADSPNVYRRNALCVSFSGVFPSFSHDLSVILGFLPVFYALFSSYRKSRLQLPSNDSDDPVLIRSDLVKQRNLEGWSVLLLWIPAACDLTGTTVSCRGI